MTITQMPTASSRSGGSKKYVSSAGRLRSLTGRPVGVVWDDDKDYRDSMTRKLRRYGFKVITRSDRALLARDVRRCKTPIKVAVIDWVDQKKRNYRAGLETVKVIAKHHQDCFVMVTTGHEIALRTEIGPDFENEALKAGADAVKLKGTFGLLNDQTAFERYIWEGILNKRSKNIVQHHRELDEKSVFAGLAAGLEVEGKVCEIGPRDGGGREAEETTLDHRIKQLYQSIREIVARPESAQKNADYRTTLQQLRLLQAQEAQRMRAYFETHRPLSREFAERFLAATDDRDLQK